MEKKAVNVFLDSNVILSGLISDKGAPRIILDIVCLRLPSIRAMTGRYNLMEIERNLSKKLPAVLPTYKKYLPKLYLKIIPLPSPKSLTRYKRHIAHKDAPVLASAVNGGADFLVTGDKKDFEELKVKGSYPFQIVSPAEFLDAILPEILKEGSRVTHK
jgi:putative PIN family toxin of toxin-antitoxin system